jgi:hypothetical protein
MPTRLATFPLYGRTAFPFWLKVTAALFLILYVTVYWRSYGPTNFL